MHTLTVVLIYKNRKNTLQTQIGWPITDFIRLSTTKKIALNMEKTERWKRKGIFVMHRILTGAGVWKFFCK